MDLSGIRDRARMKLSGSAEATLRSRKASATACGCEARYHSISALCSPEKELLKKLNLSGIN